MESWGVLCEALAASFNVVSADEDRVVIEQAVDGTEVTVEVTVVEAELDGEEPWLTVTVPVCHADALGSREALEMNGRFAVGSLAVVEDLCVLRHYIGLGSVELRAIERAVGILSHRAAALADALGRRMARTNAMFDNYAS